MAHIITLTTRCSNAQEELMNYAEETTQTFGFLNKLRHQQIQGWNEAQFINFKIKNNCQSANQGKSLSILTKYKQGLQGHNNLLDNKQQLKFKLSHYNEQIFQSSLKLDVSNDLELKNTNQKDQKENFQLVQKKKGFQENKKSRNFSISQPKQKISKPDKTVEILPKTRRSEASSKQKASRPVRIKFFPVTADFYFYQEQRKLSLKLKQYIKKCSVTLNL